MLAYALSVGGDSIREAALAEHTVKNL